MLVEIERFVNWVHRRNPEARTWKDYGYDLHFFVEVVGDRSPNEITFRDVDHFVALQSGRGFKATTINRRLAAVIALYLFLSEEDETLVCPVLPRRHHLREPLTQRYAQIRLKSYGKRCGVDITPHQLRHSCGRSFGRLVNASKDAIC